MANIPLKTIKFPGLDDTYTIAVTDTTLSKSGDPADAKATGDALETKADKDGYYTDLTAGTAKQLLSTVYVEDKVSYQYRTSGGSADIGDREIDQIVGGSIAWNQQEKRDRPSETIATVTCTNNSDGSCTLNGTATGNSVFYPSVGSNMQNAIVGHVYLALTDIKNPSNDRVAVGIYLDGTMVGETGRASIIYSNTGSTNKIQIGYRFASGTTFDNEKIFGNLFDLTQMFNTTIADYIYSLEQANAGAGVAWFNKLFPKPYYNYNAGELLSVSDLQSHDMTGFNQWDEEWESGVYNLADGSKVSNPNYIRSKNSIPVLPNTTYYLNVPSSDTETVLMWLDDDGVYTKNRSSFVSASTFTTPSYAHYMLFYTKEASYNNDICINLHWDGERDGEYEPYVKYSYALDDSLVLHGIPKLDANNSLYFDGDIYDSDGTVTRRYGIVDLGTLDWNYVNTSGQERFYTIELQSLIKTPADNNGTANIVCLKYTRTSQNTLSGGTVDKVVAVAYNGFVAIRDTAYTDENALKTALSGVKLVYEKATSSVEAATPYTSPQIVNDFGTEEYVTASLVPVGHYTKYTNNLRAKLEMAPESPSGNGDYIVRQVNGENSYVPLVFPTELPTAPSTDGSYRLKVTVSDGTPVYSWEAIS